MEKLSSAQVEAGLADLPDWHGDDTAIARTYRFHDFTGSVDFVNAVAEVAESMQHHPDIDIRYNKVTLTLSTHDSGGVTGKDLDLAREADRRAR
jgi:4a-hydroxytetrahydrobiopterin dehydratase